MSSHTKLHAILATVCILGLSACKTTPVAYDDGKRDVPDHGWKQAINEFRAQISVKGNPQIKEINSDLDLVVRVRKMPLISAWVNQRSGPFIFASPTGRLQALRVAEATVLSSTDPDKYKRCPERFAWQARDLRAADFKAKRFGLKNTKYPDPRPAFAAMKNTPCSELASAPPLTDAQQKAKTDLANQLSWLIFLHELGHIAANDRVTSIKNEEQRLAAQQREIDADLYAARNWVEVVDDPMAVFETDALVADTIIWSGHNCRDDSKNRHINGYRRFGEQLEYTRSYAISKGKFSLSDPRNQSFNSRLSELNDRLKRSNCPPIRNRYPES